MHVTSKDSLRRQFASFHYIPQRRGGKIAAAKETATSWSTATVKFGQSVGFADVKIIKKLAPRGQLDWAATG
jgi:hypothetical protein